ncbi:substrate-binding domain-containing protein [aff. Roholtiella sp. LEGE 12411]|uniref:substrate-binding domain-containing protein n=1 Tax=aff. Roholtiella sp. LEGE 12411 TaxID=1828822 RepID=UPI00187E18BF|nr:substrate-binding domain-containing protein [aff. Roholtiella sp. LEGE 12411]MBE9034174.1 substrate-binding domain-containing protein [aff. Roholtiella sp. LEGE 12411]
MKLPWSSIYVVKRFNSKIFLVVAIAATVSSLSASVVLGDVLVSSLATNEVLRFDETTGQFIGAFATKGSGGLNSPFGSRYGPDGNFYVSSFNTGQVLRYNGITGQFIDAFVPARSGGLTNPRAVTFGPDGNGYVGDAATNSILRYNGKTGEFIDTFIAPGSGGLSDPFIINFGPDGNIYVASSGTNSVLRYNRKTGKFIDAFIPSGSGGLKAPVGIALGSDNNFYVSSSGTSSVLRYNGKTGKFIDAFIPSGSGGLKNPRAVEFGGPNNDLFVGSLDTNSVLRYDGRDGSFLGVFASNATSSLTNPRGITFTPSINGVGAGATTPLNNKFFRERGASFTVNGSGTGRAAFKAGTADLGSGSVNIDFVSTAVAPNQSISDFYPDSKEVVRINNLDFAVGFPYNVPGFKGKLNSKQVCGLISGTISNWSEVGGPNLPVKRVYPGDPSGLSITINNGFTKPVCKFSLVDSSGNVVLLNPNPANDIAIAPPNPIVFNSDNLKGFAGGIVSKVASTPGAVGYAEDVIAKNAGLPLITKARSRKPFSVSAQNYIVFRTSYSTRTQADHARVVCLYISDSSKDYAQSIGYLPPSGSSDSCDNIQKL